MLINRLYKAEERISEPEDVLIETFRTEMQREKTCSRTVGQLQKVLTCIMKILGGIKRETKKYWSNNS